MSVMIGCFKYGRIPWILRNGWQREENMELEGKALCQRQQDKWSSSDELSLLVFLCPPTSHTGWWISRWFFLFYQFQWNYRRRLSATHDDEFPLVFLFLPSISTRFDKCFILLPCSFCFFSAPIFIFLPFSFFSHFHFSLIFILLPFLFYSHSYFSHFHFSPIFIFLPFLFLPVTSFSTFFLLLSCG